MLNITHSGEPALVDGVGKDIKTCHCDTRTVRRGQARLKGRSLPHSRASFCSRSVPSRLPDASRYAPPTAPITGETAMQPCAPGRFTWFKDRYGLHHVNYLHIRPLGNGEDKHDDGVCRRLGAQLRGGFF